MRQLIPVSSNHDANDNTKDHHPLPDDLKFKFQALQNHLSSATASTHIEEEEEQRHNESSIYTETDDDGDYDDEQTLNSNSSGTYISTVGGTDEVGALMALSTALSAQNEIDSLMNGIAELEDMLREEMQGFGGGTTMDTSSALHSSSDTVLGPLALTRKNENGIQQPK